jgi:hypothetical protein
MRIRLAEDRDEHVAAVDLVAAGRLDVGGGALEHALEAEGLLRERVHAGGKTLLALLEPGAELAAQPFDVAAAGADDVDDRLVVEERVEHVLDAEELVASCPCLADRLGETRLETAAEPH